MPQRTGEIIIEKIEWELYSIFKCEYDLVKMDRSETKEKFNHDFKPEIPRQLFEKEKSFGYTVLPKSADIMTKIELERNGSLQIG